MKQEHFKLDSRNVNDIRNEIGQLAKSYTPEWAYDPINPDIGSVLALIFANQMSKNIDRFNTTLERYRTELVNLMDISARPAKPAETIVLMELASEADEGIPIVAGSRLFADTEDEKEFLQAVCDAVDVPVIASGGAGSKADFVNLFKQVPTVDAGLAASVFHFGEIAIPDLKKNLKENGVNVRL